MFEDLLNRILFRRLRLERVREQFERCVLSETAENFLALLLRGMQLMLHVDREYRRNIDGFRAAYLFRSRDDHITVAATFAERKMTVREEALDDATVTVSFQDHRALRDLLLSEQPNLLDALLKQLVVVDGNLNYLYKFAYMANHLRLAFTGRA